MGGKKNSKRELIDTGRDKRFVRRDEKGRFYDVVDVGRSLSQDVRKEARTKVRRAREIAAIRNAEEGRSIRGSSWPIHFS